MDNRIDHDFTIFIVDDDSSIRDSLAVLLGLLDYRTAVFESAEAFLNTYKDSWSGCVITDLKLPGKNGIQLQEELRDRGSELPFIIITGHGDVPTARSAFLLNAVDFIEKPFNETDLCAAIEQGLRREKERLANVKTAGNQAEKLLKLTNREREVLNLVGKGMHAKEIGTALNISARTVEVHKAHLMEKLEARNVAELVRFALADES